ncbi:PepSY-associated TM helix domain-containing protein [Avibacterium sp. 21-586]|uniref:PepSY-associated TM helix domain-containing protein n=1 Tax=Avibacterium sp. 21-586 TaxID=2911534 RepID=UPI00224692D8|nr:PepSY-associated TM helix domain-containing protein [Avibacterium sp. 21-586]MCW9709470.1 PepSY-associated TM helix domain-containing protein [Avibacterium sp. 21-586]
MSKTTAKWMRILHRYFGFLLLVTMSIYAFTGVVLIYRNTDTFKHSVYIEKKIDLQLNEQQLGQKLRIKNLLITDEKDGVLYFKQGEYHPKTGEVKYHIMDYPTWLAELTRLHKSNSEYPYSWLTTVFGIALLFFCISSLWLIPGSRKALKRSLYFILAGGVMVILLILTD